MTSRYGHTLHYFGLNSTCGTGFLVHRMWGTNSSFHAVDERLSYLDLTTPAGTVRVVQCYAPTTSHDDPAYQMFLDSVEIVLSHPLPRGGKVVVVGDFNAKVGSAELGETFIGKHGLGNRNERGQTLVDFCSANQLYMLNSRFQKRDSRKWTWLAPNMQTRNAIDYVLSRHVSMFLDVSIVGSFNFASDHRLVMAKLRVPNKRFYRRPTARNKRILDKRLFSLALTDLVDRTALNLDNFENLSSVLSTAAEVALVSEVVDERISDRTRSLYAKRHQLMSAINTRAVRIEFSVVSKTLRCSLKDDINRCNLARAVKAVREGRSLKQAQQKNTVARTQISQLSKADGTLASSKHDVKRVVGEFYNKLFAPSRPSHVVNLVASEPLLPVLESEVKSAIASRPKGRSPGEDRITAEMLQVGTDVLTPHLTRIFNECLEQETVPNNFADSVITLLFKKGNPLDIKNFRPISLLSTVYKVFTTVLCRRMERDLEDNQPAEQAGFRKQFSTIDHVFAVRELMQKSCEYRFPLYMAFVDYRKAFDSVEFDSVWTALSNQGVNTKIINTIKAVYAKAQVHVRIGTDKTPVVVQRGVRQGDTISPMLFSAVVEEVFRVLDWDEYGIPISGTRLTNLRFADDIVVFSQCPHELQQMLQELSEASKRVGLTINHEKTLVMSNYTETPITVDGLILLYCEKFIYLGHRLSFELNDTPEIQRRIRAGWCAFNRYYQLLTSRTVSLALKRKVYQACIEPAILYGCETWVLRLKDHSTLITGQRRMMRKMIGVTLFDRHTNEWLSRTVRLPDIRERAAMRKWSWARHVSRMENDRWAKTMVEWCPIDAPRPPGRPKQRWRDEFEEAVGRNWMRIAREEMHTWKDKMLRRIVQILIP